mgnify:CR=1 FL=1
MWNAKIITAYPEMFPGVLGHSIIGKALSSNKWSLNIINLHDFGIDNRKSIDDSPFGGGPGMIIRPDVVEKAVITPCRTLKFFKCPLWQIKAQKLVHDKNEYMIYQKNSRLEILEFPIFYTPYSISPSSP